MICPLCHIYHLGGSWKCPGSYQFSSVQSLVVSDSLRFHEPQHARPPCPAPTPRVYSNSCPSSQWCHPTISSFVVPFSSHFQSFPASGSSPMSQFFTSGGQSIGSFSFSISPSNEYSGLISFRMDWLDLLSVQEILKSLLRHHSSKASILLCSVSLWSSSHICTWLLEKNIALTVQTLVSKVLSLLLVCCLGLL